MKNIKISNRVKKIVILGSTGSIGINALKVVSGFRDKFKVVGLSANTNCRLLAQQARRFKVRRLAIRDEARAKDLKRLLGDGTKVSKGIEGLSDLASTKESDIILVAMAGTEAIIPIVNAIKAKKRIALANKESVVSAGSIIMAMAKRHGAEIIPVDSEHSAIFQCLEGRKIDDVKKVILTGTGGPLRIVSKSIFDSLSLARILEHPTWKMGKKITVDSATLMNKGLEMIEAASLFGINCSKVQVLLHPEAIIHSMVEFKDGMILANLFYPDMRLPILYALSYPERLSSVRFPKVDFLKLRSFTFQKPDIKKFPALELAYVTAKQGGSMPACLNSANEEAVSLYLKGRIKFTQIIRLIDKVLKRHRNIPKPALDEILRVDKWAKEEVRSLC